VASRERQRRHRLLAAVRPREPSPAWADPLELAREGLNCMRSVRQSYRQAGLERLLPTIERAEEIMRQLAWGPTPVR
jgi:hypothetical protein